MLFEVSAKQNVDYKLYPDLETFSTWNSHRCRYYHHRKNNTTSRSWTDMLPDGVSLNENSASAVEMFPKCNYLHKSIVRLHYRRTNWKFYVVLLHFLTRGCQHQSYRKQKDETNRGINIPDDILASIVVCRTCSFIYSNLIKWTVVGYIKLLQWKYMSR